MGPFVCRVATLPLGLITRRISWNILSKKACKLGVRSVGTSSTTRPWHYKWVWYGGFFTTFTTIVSQKIVKGLIVRPAISGKVAFREVALHEIGFPTIHYWPCDSQLCSAKQRGCLPSETYSSHWKFDAWETTVLGRIYKEVLMLILVRCSHLTQVKQRNPWVSGKKIKQFKWYITPVI